MDIVKVAKHDCDLKLFRRPKKTFGETAEPRAPIAPREHNNRQSRAHESHAPPRPCVGRRRPRNDNYREPYTAPRINAQRQTRMQNTQLIVVAGARKCGTNALAHNLSVIAGFQTTAAVNRATRKLNGFPGEVNYPCELIGRKRTKALVAKYKVPPYARCLQRSKRVKHYALDKSPSYLNNPTCAANLRKQFPKIHVFATICEVTSRLWSRMNHVNRERKNDDASDLSKARDWPKHIMQVTRAQLAKLDAHDWNATAACHGPAAHVCDVLATSRWSSLVSNYFKELSSDHFEVWLMEELLTKDSSEIQAHLRYRLGLPYRAPNATKTKRRVVVHSNAHYSNYKTEAGDPHFAALKVLLDGRFSTDTAKLKALLPQKDIDALWGGGVQRPCQNCQRRSWQTMSI